MRLLAGECLGHCLRHRRVQHCGHAVLPLLQLVQLVLQRIDLLLQRPLSVDRRHSRNIGRF